MPAPTLVQSRGTTLGAGNYSGGTTLQFTSNVTANNLLACGLSTFIGSGGPNTVASVADDHNPAWTDSLASGQFPNNSGYTNIWFFDGTAGGVKPTVTVKLTSASSSWLSFFIVEISGLLASSPLDQKNHNNGASAGGSDSGNITTTTDNEFYLGVTANNVNAAITDEAGWTNIYSVSNNAGVNIDGQYLVAAQGTRKASWTWTGGNQWCASIISLLPVAGLVPLPGSVYPGSDLYGNPARAISY